MRKTLGLAGLLFCLIAATYAWELQAEGSSRFLTAQNLRNLLTWVGLFGILSLAQSILIISGGIDLSVGSVVGLVATVNLVLMRDHGMAPLPAVALCLTLSGVIGLWHGLLVTKGRLQPFIVTLCGLFLYRGSARLLTGDESRGFGTGYDFLKWLGSGYVGNTVIAMPLAVLLGLALVVGMYMHLTAGGRHLFAVGANEETARFSGLQTHRLKIQAYVMCSFLTGLGGLLIAFKVKSIGPSDFGNSYELYAIAGAVLGGCSLRGGSGNIPSVLIGATLIVLLRNLVNILGIPSQVEYMVIGCAILVGVFLDEMLGRRSRPLVQV